MQDSYTRLFVRLVKFLWEIEQLKREGKACYVVRKEVKHGSKTLVSALIWNASGGNRTSYLSLNPICRLQNIHMFRMYALLWLWLLPTVYTIYHCFVPHVENHRHRMLTTLAKPFHPVNMLILFLCKPRPPSDQVALGSDEDGNIQQKTRKPGNVEIPLPKKAFREDKGHLFLPIQSTRFATMWTQVPITSSNWDYTTITASFRHF